MTSQGAKVLIVDDERSITDFLSTVLEEEGYRCITAASGEDALKKLSMGDADVALLDLRLPGMSGMDVLRAIKSTYPRTVIIIVTAVGDAKTAVEAMKTGAVDYITKPFKIERVSHSVEVALHAATIWDNKSAAQGEGAETSDEEVDWTRYIDNIAKGVGIKLDSLTGHVMTITVIEQTIGIAQRLSIPVEQIDKWAQAKRKETIDKSNLMNRLSEKLERNPIAQVVLGMTELHCSSGDSYPN